MGIVLTGTPALTVACGNVENNQQTNENVRNLTHNYNETRNWNYELSVNQYLSQVPLSFRSKLKKTKNLAQDFFIIIV